MDYVRIGRQFSFLFSIVGLPAFVSPRSFLRRRLIATFCQRGWKGKEGGYMDIVEGDGKVTETQKDGERALNLVAMLCNQETSG